MELFWLYLAKISTKTEVFQSFSGKREMSRTVRREGYFALHMKGVEMESNEVTAIIELLTETLGGAIATRTESDGDELFQFAGTLASMLTFDEMVLGANQAVQNMSDDDVQYRMHVLGYRLVGKVVAGLPHCPAIPAVQAQLQAPHEHEELDKFKRSLRGMSRYVLKHSPRRACRNSQSTRLGDETL